jgi:3-hydroxyisobutyrate dehydrogenase-like beta-hydroxyacid dehydrogenase
METTLGFIGLGLMGAPMAGKLLKAGYSVAVFNRTKERASQLIVEGAEWCESPGIVAGRSDIVFTMLSNSEALEETALIENGILAGLRGGGIHIDSSTVSPETTSKLAKKYASKGAFFLHAPVLGSIPQATDGSLLLFVGGDERAFRKAEPALKCLGSKIWRFEKVEQATTTKLLCNFFIATMISGLCQALVMAKKSGIQPSVLLEIIGASALNAPMYQTKGASIIERNFKPRFFLEHMLKDVNLLTDAAQNLGVAMPFGEIAQALFLEAMGLGLAREDYSAIVQVLERIAQVEVN